MYSKMILDDGSFCRSNIRTAHSDIQNQLAEAQSTVFDAELYSKACKLIPCFRTP